MKLKNTAFLIIGLIAVTMFSQTLFAESVADQVAEASKLRKAAEQGDAKAQYELGWCYSTGEDGITKSDAEAVKWYRKAAEQGHAVAQFKLGLF